MNIYTAQIGLGKKLKSAGNVLLLDITVKSSVTPLELALAPTWDNVAKWKGSSKSAIDWGMFCIAYRERFDRMPLSVLRTLATLSVTKDATIDSIVLLCYCGENDNCHRKLSAKLLSEESLLNFEYIGEITGADIKLNNIRQQLAVLTPKEGDTCEKFEVRLRGRMVGIGIVDPDIKILTSAEIMNTMDIMCDDTVYICSDGWHTEIHNMNAAYTYEVEINGN